MAEQASNIFTQSSLYGTFLKSMNHEFWIFGLYEDKKLLGGSLIAGVRAKRGSYLVMNYGPVLDFAKVDHLAIFTQFLVFFGRENNYHFLRMSPFVETSSEYLARCKEVGYRLAPIHILAEHTWLLRLNEQNQTLFRNMNKNHRNLIKRCEREGVLVEAKKDSSSLACLNDMHDVVAKRHGFRRFSKQFISNEFSVFAPRDQALIYEAKLPDGRVDASAMIIFYGNMACYRHSASLNLDKRLPTSYLIQWRAIIEAQKRALEWYNFWGIAPERASKKHPFWGISHFKKGFGGIQKNLLPCQDFPLSSRYAFVWILERLRSLKRGFR